MSAFDSVAQRNVPSPLWSFRRLRWIPALALLILCGPAGAEVFTDCGILGSVGGGLGAGNAVCADSATDRGGTASASATIGALGADASVYSTRQGLTQATATAIWFDTILISSPDVEDGTSGTLVFGYYFTGSLSATGHGVAAVGLSFGSCIGPLLCSPGTSLEAAQATATTGDNAVGTVGDHVVHFRFGELTNISMGLSVSARKLEAFEPPFEGSADVLFSGTAYWDGVLDVLVDGQSVPYTLVTGSGIDLRESLRPVPLPAGGFLLLSALGVLGAGLRRRPPAA